jgi:predicted phage terminase large subunit-like protein
LVVAGFLDSASGRGSGRGDYAAIATVGMDPSGWMYALDLWIRRAPPTRQIEAMFELHRRWRYRVFGIEANCFQQLLLLPIEEERRRRRAVEPAGPDGFATWRLAVREVTHNRSKELRIAALEPLLSNGWLRLCRSLPDLFWTELESFPRGEHDDGLDALESALALLRGLEPVSASPAAPRPSVRRMRHF